MSMLSKPHKLSDGNTVRIRTRQTIAGTFFEEVHSLPGRKTFGTLYRLDNSMFLVLGDNLCRITNPDYSYASDDKTGAEIAMRFFVAGAEACIKESRDSGLPLIDFYVINKG